MKMFRSPRPGRCASCEGEIGGRPVMARHLEFCCLGCLEDGPCICSYEADLAEDGVDRLGLLVAPQSFAGEINGEREPVSTTADEKVSVHAA